uniref:Uncharacterized protein n=1 Tax=Fagus sylvatica TaxID=28930 RepID=A0A2N9JB84_FAGSY
MKRETKIFVCLLNFLFGPARISDSVESIEKTSTALKVLKQIGAAPDADKAKDSHAARSDTPPPQLCLSSLPRPTLSTPSQTHAASTRSEHTASTRSLLHPFQSDLSSPAPPHDVRFSHFTLEPSCRP